MRVLAKGYRFTISYILLSVAIILAFVRMEIIANEAIQQSCEATREAKLAIVTLVNGLVETSDNPEDPELLRRRDLIINRINVEECNG